MHEPKWSKARTEIKKTVDFNRSMEQPKIHAETCQQDQRDQVIINNDLTKCQMTSHTTEMTASDPKLYQHHE